MDMGRRKADLDTDKAEDKDYSQLEDQGGDAVAKWEVVDGNSGSDWVVSRSQAAGSALDGSWDTDYH